MHPLRSLVAADAIATSAAVLLATHHAKKLHLSTLARLEDSLGGLDGVFAEDEDRRHDSNLLEQEITERTEVLSFRPPLSPLSPVSILMV
jgi:hypothetical protein